jgi:hypothetical protein
MLGCPRRTSAASLDPTPPGKISRTGNVRATIHIGINENRRDPFVNAIDYTLAIRINYDNRQVGTEALNIISQRDVSMADHRAWCLSSLICAGLYLDCIAD